MLEIIILFNFTLSSFEKDFPTVSSFLSTTAIFIALDEDIYREVKRFQEKNQFVDKISPVITELGGGFVPLFFASTGFYGMVFKKEREKKVCVSGIKACFFTGAVVFIGKHFTGRPRPGVVHGEDRWLLFYHPLDFSRYKKGKMPYFDAFPSGHTALAFTWASLLSEYYGNIKFIPPFLYTIAALAGLSRITEGEHWFSDVFVGAFIGYFSGKVFSKQKKSIDVTFNFLENSLKISVKFNFNLI